MSDGSGPIRLRVVIADDAADFRFLLRMLLDGDDRFDVVGEAGNGQEAVTMSSEHQPHAVLLDLAMPVMDGLQAIPEIHRVAPETQIVVLSGFEEAQMGRRALSLKATAYIEKGQAHTVVADTLIDVCRSP
jgi:YesN/AraC family two-component response regulator